MTRWINWLGVIAALAMGQTLSFVWYGLLFGQKLQGLMAASARTPAGLAQGAGLALVMLIGLAVVLGRMGVQGYGRGAAAGALLWFVFPFIGELMNVVYMGEGLLLLEANAGYTLIFLTLAGALIGGLKFKAASAA